MRKRREMSDDYADPIPRFERLESSEYRNLDANDYCLYIGEYTAKGGFQASVTNQQILNLKKKPSVPANQLRYKDRAVNYWAIELYARLNLPFVAQHCTLVPAPPSKPAGHPEYDDRMIRVLNALGRIQPGIDVRPLVVTHAERVSQHEGNRLSIEDLAASMSIDGTQLDREFRSTVIIVDDVFTVGGTFKAVQKVLASTGIVANHGIFLAKTVWPGVDLNLFDAF